MKLNKFIADRVGSFRVNKISSTVIPKLYILLLCFCKKVPWT